MSERKFIAAWLPALRLQKMKSFVSSRPSAAEALLSSSSSSTATAPPAASAAASARGGAASAAAASFLTCASASQAASYVDRSALRREAEPASKGEPRRAPPLAAPALEAPGASTTPKRMGAPCWKRELMKPSAARPSSVPGSTTKTIVKTFLRQKEIWPHMFGRSSSRTVEGHCAYRLSLATSLSTKTAGCFASMRSEVDGAGSCSSLRVVAMGSCRKLSASTVCSSRRMVCSSPARSFSPMGSSRPLMKAPLKPGPQAECCSCSTSSSSARSTLRLVSDGAMKGKFCEISTSARSGSFELSTRDEANTPRSCSAHTCTGRPGGWRGVGGAEA